MARPGPAVQALLELLDEAYGHRSWHGPNLRGSLRGLDAAQACWRPGPGRHSAWELVVHAAYWKYAAWRRITGEKRGSFARAGSNWFAAEAGPSAVRWRTDLKLLADCHDRLRAAVATLGDEDLVRRLPRGRGTAGWVVRGAAAHDLYHAGQIQLLKRLMKGHEAR
ncbi:MAG TPA: DinB family protein [Vicinamibacteria bacterium]|nr:DinB family protein [Vicinamibacteria bacterium]